MNPTNTPTVKLECSRKTWDKLTNQQRELIRGAQDRSVPLIVSQSKVIAVLPVAFYLQHGGSRETTNRTTGL